MTLESYQALPYVPMAYPQSHPRVLATVAALFGLQAPPPATARVLELGCAQGGNLIPMAVASPGAHFVGIDYSPRQIEAGQAVAAALGLENLELRCLSIMDIDAGFGQFDYIIAHGVFSWVPPEVRDRLLEICRRQLAPDGVAYVSYNAYPGWHINRMLREMMLYHTRHRESPVARVAGSRALIDFLAEAVPAASGPFGAILNRTRALFAPRPDADIFHDYLEEHNEPFYFHQFAAMAAARGLQYLGDAAFVRRGCAELPPKVAAWLKRHARGLIDYEQYADFLVKADFRRTLLCHAAVPLRPFADPGAVAGLHASTAARPVVLPREPRFAGAEGFRNPQGEILVERHPLAARALRFLAERAPRAVPCEALLDEVSGGGPAAREADRKALSQRLLAAFARGFVELSVAPPEFCPTVSRRPLASPLARRQAASGAVVTNLRHQNVGLNPLTRQLLQWLDGTQDHAALADKVKAAFDGEKAPGAREVAESLDFLARAALLQA